MEILSSICFISVVLNSTDERGRYIYFNSLYQVAVEGRDKWRDIGIALNLNPKDLTSIERSYQLPGYRFKKMLLKWFEVNEKCYLSTFTKVLKGSNVQLVSLIPSVVETIISTHTEETKKSEYIPHFEITLKYSYIVVDIKARVCNVCFFIQNDVKP